MTNEGRGAYYQAGVICDFDRHLTVIPRLVRIVLDRLGKVGDGCDPRRANVGKFDTLVIVYTTAI